MRNLIGLAVLTASAVITAASAIAAECGPLKVMTSLPLMPLGGDNAVTVPVTIAGASKKLLVDTGAFMTTLSRRTVRELNLETMRSADRMGVRLVTGAFSNQMVHVPSIAIGTLRQNDAYVFVAPNEEGYSRVFRDSFDGLLGQEMLRNFDVDFDFGAHKLNLISQDHCAGKVTYWSAPALAIVPFTLSRGGQINIRVRIDGKRMTALLDTGAVGTYLNLDVARRLFGLDIHEADAEQVADVVGRYRGTMYRRRFKTIEFEGVAVNDPTIFLYPDMLKNAEPIAPRTGSLIRERNAGFPDAIIGMSVLSKLHLYIANKENKLYITEAGPRSPTPLYEGDGFAALQRGDFPTALEIYRPLAESGNPAAQYGLASLYLYGLGVPENFMEATKWLHKAADQRFVPAQRMLGLLYSDNIGGSQNLDEAVKWLRLAANAGDGLAQYSLAYHYAAGRGVATNIVNALTWYELASDSEGPQASVATQTRDQLWKRLPDEQRARVVALLARCQESRFQECGNAADAEPIAGTFSIPPDTASGQPPGQSATATAPVAIVSQSVTPLYYPPVSVRRKEEGTVGIIYRVTAGGYVDDCVVTLSSRRALLDDAACQMAKSRWHFTPAMIDDMPVPVWSATDVTFALSSVSN